MEENIDLAKRPAVIVYLEKTIEKFTHPNGVTFRLSEGGDVFVYVLEKDGPLLAAIARGAWTMVKHAN